MAVPDIPQERRLATDLPGPVSRELETRRRRAASGGVATSVPIYVERAQGAVLVDVDGNSLIDLGSGIAVNGVGHAAAAVVDAVVDQAARFAHTCFMINPYEGYVDVCERLNAHAPGDHEKRSALFNSGAEAIENVVKIARRVTGRQAVVVFDHAYHGRTNLTMALTARNVPYKDKFGPFAPEVYRVPTSYPYRDPVGMTGAAAAARAIDQIERLVGADNVACLLAEPIPGEGGFIVPAPGFLATLAEWCTERGVLFAADEIQTGFCRTGRFFACEHEGVVPDLMATAKAMAGGLPLGAVTGASEIMDAVPAGGLGGTFGGNPISCAAAVAAMDMMVDADLAASARSRRGRCHAAPRRTASRASRCRRCPGPGSDAGIGTGPPGHDRTRSAFHPGRGGGLLPGRRGGLVVRDLRQRDPAAATTGHRRCSPGRRVGRGRGRSGQRVSGTGLSR